MNRKQTIKSQLYAVSDDRAAEICNYAKSHSITATVAWLKRNGLKTSYASVSRWLSDKRLKQRLVAAEERALRFKRWTAKSFPDIDERELDRRANLMFQFEAVECGDPKAYLTFSTARHKAKVDTARLEQRERAMAQAREKWLAAQRTKIEAGLDALYLEVKDNKEARDLFQKFKAVATKATT